MSDGQNKTESDDKESEVKTQLYTMKQVAKICGLAYASLWYHVNRGTFPVKPIMFGKTYRFPKHAIDNLVNPTEDAGEQE